MAMVAEMGVVSREESYSKGDSSTGELNSEEEAGEDEDEEGEKKE